MQHARAYAPLIPVDAPREARQVRRFLAHLAGHEMRQRVEADSFIEAALLFAENVHDDCNEDLVIVVVDVETDTCERFSLAAHAHEVKAC